MTETKSLRVLDFAIMLAIMVGMTILSPLSLNAQPFYGSIVGTVTDTTGAIVADAAVTITNKSTNEKHTAKSNTAGEYHLWTWCPQRIALRWKAPFSSAISGTRHRGRRQHRPRGCHAASGRGY